MAAIAGKAASSAKNATPPEVERTRFRRNRHRAPATGYRSIRAAGSARVYSRHGHDPVRRHARDRPSARHRSWPRPRRASRGLYRFAPGARRARAPRASAWSTSTWARLLERVHLGAFGTGRVSPRSAGRRSSLGACPVVVPRAAGFRCVRRERIGRVARLGRERRRSIHVDAFAIEARAGRGLRGRDAAADEQRCESEIHVPHGLDPWRLLPCGNATKHPKFPRSPTTGPWETTPPCGSPICVSAPTDHDRPASGYRAPLELRSRRATAGLPAIPRRHRVPARARNRAAAMNQWDTGMVTQDRIFDRHELPGGRVTREKLR